MNASGHISFGCMLLMQVITVIVWFIILVILEYVNAKTPQELREGETVIYRDPNWSHAMCNITTTVLASFPWLGTAIIEIDGTTRVVLQKHLKRPK